MAAGAASIMNHALPEWIERWLGIPPAGSGEGTLWSLEFSWPWTPWLTVLFVAGTAALVGGLYLRETRGKGRLLPGFLIAARLSLVALLMVMIAQVVLALKRTGLPTVALIVDDSASMGIEDRYPDSRRRESLQRRVKEAGFDALTRLNLAKTLLLENDQAIVRKLGEDYQLKVYFLSKSVRPASAESGELARQIKELAAQGESSQLGRGVRAVLDELRGTQPAAIVLLSDGITSEGESLSEVASYARRKGVPLYTVALGDNQPVRDLEINDLLVDEVVFVNDVVQFEFTLHARGYTGEQVEVILAEQATGEPLARTLVAITGEGQPQKGRLSFRPTTVGEFEYTVEARPRPDELNSDNNRQSRVISVRKEQIRVLLVQAYPSFEYRYLKNLLERDSAIELHTVLQESDPQYSEADKSALPVFPFQREELFAYDVVILGDVNPGFLSSAATDHLAQFVREKGGGLIMISGPLYTPTAFQGTALESVIPVELSSLVIPASEQTWERAFQVVPTDLGFQSSALQLGDSPEETQEIWRKLPPLYWYLPVAKLKPSARVLAEHSTESTTDGRRLPLIVLAYGGAGKVLFHACDETWRWRYQVGDAYFARYWVQSIRFLSRSKLLGKDHAAELSADRRQYKRGEPVRLRLRFFDEAQAPAQDDGVTLVIERSDHERRSVALRRVAAHRGIFEGSWTPAGVGNHHAWVVAPMAEGRAAACDFLVVAPPGELEQLTVDLSELERAAKQTGGGCYTFFTARKLLGDLPAGRHVPIDSLPNVPLWNQWPVLLVLIVVLAAEWIVRKSVGLV
jgi:uncharacterized membrane protein